NRIGGNRRYKSAILAFTVTFFLILAVSIPAMIIVSGKYTSGAEKDKFTDSLSMKWEAIPSDEKIVKADIVEGGETQETETVIQYDIPKEDEEYTHIIETADDGSVTIGFAGDILFDDNYAVGNTFRKNGNTAEGVIGLSLLEKMRNVDIMMVNNEFPYSNRGTPTEGKTYTFRARPETAQILGTMGVDIVGLANNHAYDHGEQALLDTFDILDSVGVEYVGAGRNIDEASHTVYYITESGMKIAFICATQIERLSNPDTKEATATSAGVFRCLDDTLLLERIRQAKEKNAFVIVFVHWGTEGTSEIDYLQRDQSKEMVEAGADLIIGGHPHVLQKIDYVQGVPVVYSLGNYIFNSKTLDTCMIISTIHTDGTVNLQMVPAVQSGCSVNEAFDSEAQRIFNYMQSLSPGITIDSGGYIYSK
ncbi:MAG: CapA family protein, partial [Butyrivibrio sp.]|nr:CapA family protein [Butyrivibrio sp.]